MRKVYNRYIGNTGKFVRVEDSPRPNTRNAERLVAKPPPQHSAPPQQAAPPHQVPPAAEGVKAANVKAESIKSKSLFGGLKGLGGLGGLGGGLGGLTSGFKGMFDHLPFGLDLGDILLLLLLLFFFFESGDEEFIIILAVIAYSIFKER